MPIPPNTSILRAQIPRGLMREFKIAILQDSAIPGGAQNLRAQIIRLIKDWLASRSITRVEP